ncbi:MAG: hypothetical protein K2Q26_12485 [Bdellovibrionales bacterium]|nr:hypothetical protein [Bdellovibrionales bacterium]
MAFNNLTLFSKFSNSFLEFIWVIYQEQTQSESAYKIIRTFKVSIQPILSDGYRI